MRLDEFQGVNAGYVLELYERYPAEPRVGRSGHAPGLRIVDASVRPYRPRHRRRSGRSRHPEDCRRRQPRRLHPALRPSGRAHRSARLGADRRSVAVAAGATASPTTICKRLPASLVDGPVAESSANAFEAIERLRRIYCSTTGFDYAHVFVPEERDWLRHAAESGRFLPPMDAAIGGGRPRSHHARSRSFERFLHRTFPGKTRFSVEGLDMLVPILDEIICGAADSGARHALLGMAHRGRLNVLAHVLDKPYAQILAEFKDPVAAALVPDRPRLDGRREVSRRRAHGRAARADVRHDGAESEPSRGRRPGGRRHGARRRDRGGSAGAPRASTAASRCRSSFTATRRSRARASSPRR